jgi:hypothetical protein
MPNWSRSRISITLPPFCDDYQWHYQRQIRWEIFRNLRDYIDDLDLRAVQTGPYEDNFNPFQILRPRPADADWYDWNCHNWGTKWDLCHGHGEIIGRPGEPKTIIIEGNTAWSPPDELIEYLSDELGFEVEALHISQENGTWGDHDCGNSGIRELNYLNIDEDDSEDPLALEIKSWETTDEEKLCEILQSYALFGVGSPNAFHHYRFSGEILDGQWIYEEIDCMIDDAIENYLKWKDNHNEQADIIKQLRFTVLELYEKKLETGQINEGTYLKEVNELKDLDATGLSNLAVVVVDRERTVATQMTRYYNHKPEPQLVQFYN